MYMRNIKFRGKRQDNGEWVVGDLWTNPTLPDDPLVRISTWKDIDGVPVNYEYTVMPETVGQFTGLKDKNGVDIYEGDILKSFSPSVPSYEVFYSRSSYLLRYKLKNGEWYDWGPLFRMEEIQWEGRLPLCPDVIGNIYDNPELLNPAGGQSGVNNMNIEPKDQEVKEQPADAVAPASEQATQESAEEGTTEG